MKLREQIENLFKEIPKSQNKNSIMDEIMDNLTDKVNDLIENGMEESDAIMLALDEFGEIDDIKDVLMEQEFTRHYKSSVAKKNFEYSCLGSILIISSLLFIDFYYLHDILDKIYLVIPSILVLWWPITMFYLWRKSKDFR